MRDYKSQPDAVDVSEGLGVPLGGIGTGYCVYGKFGFILPNFDDMPGQGKYEENMNDPFSYDYYSAQGQTAFMAFVVSDDNEKCVLQGEGVDWIDASPASDFRSFAYMPLGFFEMWCKGLGVRVEVKGFSPMIPRDLKNSTIPVQCYEIKIFSDVEKKLTVSCVTKEEKSENNFVFVTENGKSTDVVVGPGAPAVVRAYCAWYYPIFHTPSPVMKETYVRYYTLEFRNAGEVVSMAKRKFDEWEKAICDWHDNIGVPNYLKRILFSSLSSTVTSTMLSTDPYIMEIEMPHRWINTADVSVYSGWIYVINWPELEKMYMEMYLKAIPEDGENKGMVWHSLWSDILDYVEEPMFLGHIYRDRLWFGGGELFDKLYEKGKLALEKIYKLEYEHLIESLHGNQTYDAWMMPGISAYVNSAWVCGLYGMAKMSEEKGEEILLKGERVADVAKQAAISFDRFLWDEENGYYHCFKCTENSAKSVSENAMFTDQMFGKWLISLDGDMPELFPKEKIRRSLLKVFENNRIYTADGASCWVNGMLPGKTPYLAERHAMNCWLGSQLSFASTLCELGEEDKAFEIIKSVDAAFKNRHLAAGEWLYSVSEDGTAVHSASEICKDTPRFAPYPRYKCFWEFIVRMAGLKICGDKLVFKPIKTIDFHLKNVVLAGVKVDLEVKKDWNLIVLGGKEEQVASVPRSIGEIEIKFLRKG